MQVTFHGQSCLAVELHGKSLLFDPILRENELARDVDVPAVRTNDFLRTHGHLGHVADVGEPAGGTGAPVIASLAAGHRLEIVAASKKPVWMPVGSSRAL